MNIEAEGQELILSNENGDTAIIPKIHRSKVLNWIKEGNYKAIDDLVGSLPTMEDYAEDGSLYPDGGPGKSTTPTKNQELSVTDVLFNPKKVGKEIRRRLQENLNPEDYAGLPSRIKSAVIDNIKDPERERRENLPPLQEGEEPDADRIRIDVNNLYSGKPQKYNTLSLSQDKPTRAKDKTATYYSINDPSYIRGVTDEIEELKRRKTAIEENLDELKLSESEKEKLFKAAYVVDRRIPRDPEPWTDKLVNKLPVPGLKTAADLADYDKSINKKEYEENEAYIKSMLPKLGKIAKIYEGQDPVSVVSRELSRYNYKTQGITPDTRSAIMQNHFLTFGKDDKGNYVSYNDVWDINPFPALEEAGIQTNFGKPVNLYGRIYYDKNKE